MKRSLPLQVVVYQDVLCAWSYVAQPRLDALRLEFGELLQWRVRPYALRIADRLPSTRERRKFLAELVRARQEPEGARLSPDLWHSGDSPRSSIPALVALEAARIQSPELASGLSLALRRTALEAGLNVSRTDVLFELAHQQGLHMGRFAAALASRTLERLVLNEHRAAQEKGVKGSPTLVIGERWMISGVRELSEYRTLLQTCLRKRPARPRGEPSETLH
jgi:predicted DsbA family dithiol-disulfide isomerase